MEAQSGKAVNGIFKGVYFYLANIPPSEIEKAKQLLKDGGAQRDFYLTGGLVTHVISDSTDFAEFRQAKDADIPVVTTEWITLSIKCGIMLPCKPFCPEKNLLFSSVVACPSQILKKDLDNLAAMITYAGGQFEWQLSASCTHLVVGKARGKKFEKAVETEGQIKVVTPEWVIDSLREEKLMDENEYFPISGSPTNPEDVSDLGSVASPARVHNPSRVSTPKMNDGVPSTLMSPITPTVKMSTAGPDESPVETATVINETLLQQNKTTVDVLEDDSSPDLFKKKTTEPGAAKGLGLATESKKMPDSSILEGIPTDMLKGHVFSFAEYEKRLHSATFKVWLQIIKKFAGKVEPYSTKTTHLLCVSQSTSDYKKALADGKKIATAHWLNEVLVKKKLFTPQSALHLPMPLEFGVPGCRVMLMTVSGYEGAERALIKNLIYVLGAHYTGYMCKRHSHLICKSAKGDKYVKAKEWDITVTNGAWLSDMMLAGKVIPVSSSPRYTKLGEEDELAINEELAKHLTATWKEDKPIDALSSQLQKETTERSSKRKMSHDSTEGEAAAPEPVYKQRKSDESTESPKVLVLFTGLTGPAVYSLTQTVKKMKGEVAKNVRSCTHLIAPRITRTVKFLSAISICKHIVMPSWIEASSKAGNFLDEGDFILNDPDLEESLGFKLKTSLQKARARPVFEGLKFYVTPNVVPAPGPMREIVECAGGELAEITLEEETIKRFRENKAKNNKSHIITCEDDREIWEPLMKDGYDVYNVELVLSGVMKQEIEWDIDFEDFSIDLLSQTLSVLCFRLMSDASLLVIGQKIDYVQEICNFLTQEGLAAGKFVPCSGWHTDHPKTLA